MCMNRREFLLSSVSLAAMTALMPATASVAESNADKGMHAGEVALNRGFDLGASNIDNVSNYSRPEFLIAVDSDIEEGATIEITVDGRPYVSHSLSITDYNAGGFSQKAPALSSGSHVIAGNITGNGVTKELRGFTYSYDASISTPTITGETLTTTSNPNLTVSFGETKPQPGDVLALLAKKTGTGSDQYVTNAVKTLSPDEVISTTINASGLELGFWDVACYVYRPTANIFSQVSPPFSVTVEPAAYVSYAPSPTGQKTDTHGNATTSHFDSFVVTPGHLLFGLTCGSGHADQTLVGLKVHIPDRISDPMGTSLTILQNISCPDGSRPFFGVWLAGLHSNTAAAHTTCDVTASWSKGIDGAACQVFILNWSGTPNTKPYQRASAQS